MKKTLTILTAIAMLFMGHTAHAAIAFDASSTIISTGFATGATYTGTHVVGSVANGFMTMCAEIWQDVAGAGTVSSASFNGNAMTKATSTLLANMGVEMWYQTAPTSGSHTTSVTVTGNSDDRQFIWSSWSGVNQSTPVDGTASNGDITTGISTTTKVTASTDMLQDCVSHFGTQTLTSGAGQTLLKTNITGSTGISSSYEATTTTGATGRMSYVTTGANDWSYITLSFQAAASVANSAFWLFSSF